MKKEKIFICLLALSVMLCLFFPIMGIRGHDVQAASKNQKACKAYKNFLKKSKIKWSSWENAPKNEIMFVCKDINGDGVKELLLRWNQASHASGWDRIYIYSSGKVKSIGNFTSISYYTNKKYFVNEYSNQGSGYIQYYKVNKKGKKISLASYKYSLWVYPDDAKGKVTHKVNVDGDDIYYHSCKVNSKSTTYSKCMKKIKSIKKNAKKSKYKYYKNTSYNRNKYIN